MYHKAFSGAGALNVSTCGRKMADFQTEKNRKPFPTRSHFFIATLPSTRFSFVHVTHSFLFSSKCMKQIKLSSRFAILKNCNFGKKSAFQRQSFLRSKCRDVVNPLVSTVQVGPFDRTFLFDPPALGGILEYLK